MGCTATSMVLSANKFVNIQQKMVYLAVTEKTQ